MWGVRGNKWKVDFRFIKLVNRRTNMAAEIFVHCAEFEMMTTDDDR